MHSDSISKLEEIAGNLRTREGSANEDKEDVDYFQHLSAGAATVFGEELGRGDQLQALTKKLLTVPREVAFKSLSDDSALYKDTSHLEFTQQPRKRCRRGCCNVCSMRGLFVFFMYTVFILFPCAMYGTSFLMYVGTPSYFERFGNLGIMLTLGFLFLTLSEGFFGILRRVTCCMRMKIFQAMVNNRRYLHAVTAIAFAGFVIIHTFAQIFGIFDHITRGGVVYPRGGGSNSGMTDNILRDTPEGFEALRTYNSEDNYFAKYALWMKSLPSITGWILVAMFIAGVVVSIGVIRRKFYEVFWYSYQALLVAGFILMTVHGSRGWFNGEIMMTPCIAGLGFLIYVIDKIVPLIRNSPIAKKTLYKKFEIVSAEVAGTGSAGKIIISNPSNFYFLTGQVIYLHCPSISKIEWHPFTIGSCSTNTRLFLNIEGIEDGWTLQFLKAVQESILENKAFPVISIDGPYSSPAEESRLKRKLIFFGEGYGITAFLGFLDQKVKDLPATERPALLYEDEESECVPNQRSHFYWICNNFEQMIWLRSSLVDLLSAPVECTKSVRVNLYFASTEGQTSDCTLFLLALKEWCKNNNPCLNLHFFEPPADYVYSEIKNTMIDDDFQGNDIDERPQGWKCYTCGSKFIQGAVQHAGFKIRAEGGDMTVYPQHFQI